MAERLVQHRHCKVCGKAVAPSDETCSDECATTLKARQKSKKQTQYLYYVSIVVLLIVLWLSLSGNF
jgi:predicted nucleic acid-binding Zn ribbon protein